MKTAARSSVRFGIIFTGLFLFQVQTAFSLTWAYDTYIGNGVDNTAITGLSFQPDLVIIKGTAATPAFIRISAESGANSKQMDVAGAYATDAIESIVPTGFNIGTNAAVNTNGATYNFVAFQAGSDLVVGSYTGGGGFSQTISGLGFTPAFVIVFSNYSLNTPVYTTTEMVSSGAAEFGNAQIWTNYITALNSGSFTVGSYCCNSGQVYYYAAFKAVAGTLTTGLYSGIAADQNISTPGMTPNYVIAANGSVFEVPVQKMPSNAAAESAPFAAKATNTTDITALNASSFTVKASSPDANSTTNMNYFVAIGNGIAFPLPINLIGFGVQCAGGKTVANWSTASETNNALFEVEYTSDGLNYMPAGSLKGSGNSSTVHFYSLQLEGNPDKAVYYHLKQTDFNGKTTVSQPVLFQGCHAAAPATLAIFPNPASGELHVQYELKSDETVDMILLADNGQIVRIFRGEGVPGLNEASLSLQDLAAGLYILRFSTSSDNSESKAVRFAVR